ncbi:MAG: DUF1554 domain-containing protein [bacterium]|nr:DUF1554 domain-containing protein [bacterium]
MLLIIPGLIFSGCWYEHPLVGITGAPDDSANDVTTLAFLAGGLGIASPGFTSSTVNLTVNEGGSAAVFDLRLNAAPDGDVVVDLAVSDATEAYCPTASLSFTPDTWAVPQQVTIWGVDDAVADGNQTVQLLLTLNSGTSDTSGYTDIDPTDITIINSDDDQPGATVSLPSLTVSEGATTVPFTVVLNTEPDNTVVIDIANPDTTEATVDQTSLSFNAGNWNTPQPVNVTGVDDALIDGPQSFSLSITLNAGSTLDTTGYAAIDPDDVAVTNTDDDSPGLTFVGAPVTSVEGGAAQNFTIQPNTQPAGGNLVSVSIVSNDTSEVTVSPANISWNNADWTTAKTVTVTPVDDNLTDGAQNFTISVDPAASTATGYSALGVQSVNVTHNDNDTAGFIHTGTPVTTQENSTSSNFTLRPQTEPAPGMIVSVAISSNDTSEGSVSPSNITWSNADWTTAKSVTVTPVDDNLTDGSVGYTININPAASTEAAYAGLGASTVNATTNDDDAAGFVFTGTPLTTTEGGAAVQFTVRPQTEPMGGNNVQLAISSSDTTEVTVSPANLSWTNADWTTAKTVTVTPVDDSLTDGTIGYTINLNPGASTEATYSGLGVQTVNGNHGDDDTAGFSFSSVPVTTSEGGGAVDFTMRPNTQPAGGNIITATFVSNDTSEGTVSGSLSWNSGDWTTFKTVSVTPQNDDVADGNIGYTISVSGGTSTETSYTGVNTTVNVTNNDDDSVGYTISGINRGTTELGGTASFSVSLTSEPTGTVNIGLSSSDTSEGTVGASVSFNAGDWNTPKNVTVTGVDDGAVDGNITYSIVTATPTGSDGSGYTSANPADVSVVNWDNETRRIYTTSGQWLGGALGGTAGADANCTAEAATRGYPGTWKALLAQGNASFPPTRIACTSSNCTVDEGVDWVLYANMTYYRADDNATIGTTTGGRVFSFPLTTAFATGGPRAFTNFFADWRTTGGGGTCAGWTSTSAGSGGISDPYVTGTGAISGGGYNCGVTVARLVCAEQ